MGKINAGQIHGNKIFRYNNRTHEIELADGHKIYSIELEELNKPAELKNRTGIDSSAGSEGSTQNNLGNATGVHYAEEPSTETISQGAEDSNTKYSLDASDNSGESFLQRIKNFIGGLPRNQRIHTLKDGEQIYISLRGLDSALGINAENLAPVMSDKDYVKIIRSQITRNGAAKDF